MEFIETNSIELKRSFNDTFEREIVAFLNTGDGTIYVGVEDNGNVVGVENVDKTFKDIANVISDKISPNAQDLIETSAIYVDGKTIIKTNVKKGNSLYYIKKYGRSSQGCYIRIGSTCRSMTEEQIESAYIKTLNIEEMSIMEKRSTRQLYTFNLLKQALIGKGFHINEKTFNETFHLLNSQGQYNQFAELLADENSISIKVAVFNGKDKTKFLKRNEYGFTSLIVSMQKVMDYCDAINETYIKIDGLQRQESKMFDRDAFREAWINACVHNDWRKGTPPAVYVFDDRLEIHSIGGIPKGITKEKFLSGESHPVNDELMRLFLQLEIVEQTGHGVPIVVEKYGEGAYNFDDNFVIVTIPFNKKFDNKNGPVKPENGPVKPENGPVKPENGPVNLRGIEELIVNLIHVNNKVKYEDFIKSTGKSRTTIKRIIKNLKDNNVIRRIGDDKYGYWEIVKD